MIKKIIPLVILLLIIASFTITSCNKNNSGTLNYSKSENWILNPETISKEVDVFYVYPTVIRGTKNLNLNLNDEAQRNTAENKFFGTNWCICQNM